jgi:hypothetical protein
MGRDVLMEIRMNEPFTSVSASRRSPVIQLEQERF